MRKTKHWLMTIAALLCSMGMSAENIVDSGTCGDNLIWKLSDNGTLTIQGTGEMTSSPWISSYQSNIKNVLIGEGVINIEYYAFSACRNLTSITIPESVTSIEAYAFLNCSGLTSITLPEKVTSIGNYAFNNCSSLTSITIPEKVTSIGNRAFDNTAWYNNQPAGVVYAGKVLYKYKGTMSNNTNIVVKEDTKSITQAAFYGCTGLTTISLPTSVMDIGIEAFYGCSSLTSINIPEGVTNIGYNTFLDCSSLTSIIFPDGVTRIGNSAFGRCRSLISISFSESVASIEDNAFRECSSLRDVYCYAEIVPMTGSYVFSGSNLENATLYVSAKSLQSYKTTEPWSSFGNIVTLAPEDVTITMNQYGSGTYCSEYALDFSKVEGLKAYAATGFNTETGIVTLTRVMTAKPGMGLFIKGEPGEYVVPTLEKTNDNSLNMLVGTLEDVTVGKLSSDERYVNYKYTIDNDELKFWRFDDGFTIGAGKAYLQISIEWLPAMETRSIGIRFDEGGTTDIEDLELSIQNSELIYDLMGRRVASPKKGELYIINGKKVIF